MKQNELIGIYHHMEQISPEAAREQRMAELNNLATYRSQRIAAYMAWSKPDAIAERQKKHDEEAAAALANGKRLADLMRKRDDEAKLERELSKAPSIAHFTVKPSMVIRETKPVKLTMWQRIKKFFARR